MTIELLNVWTTITHNLRYEVEFMYVSMWSDIHRRNKFTLSLQMGVVRHDWACPQLCQIVSPFHLNKELIYKLGFLYVARDPRITNTFNHFKCVWSGMPKMIQNK